MTASLSSDDSNEKHLSAESHSDLAWSLADAGNSLKAISEIQQAIDLEPSNPTFLIFKAQFLLDMDEVDSASDVLDKALEMDPSSHHGWSLHGSLLKRKGEFRKAASSYRKSVEIEPTVASLTLLAMAEQHFDLTAALRHAEMALDIEPEWEDALILRNHIKAFLDESRRND